MKTAALTVAAYVVACLASPVHAYSSYVNKVPNAQNVVSCDGTPSPGIGHFSPSGGGSRNTFGEAFAAAGYTWTTTLCQADSDGDGVSNGAELGDPACTWTEGAVPQVVADAH